MARTYKRDSNGRFAGGGGSNGGRKGGTGSKASAGAAKPKAKPAGSSKPKSGKRKGSAKPPPPPPWSAAMVKASKARTAPKSAGKNAAKPANKIVASPRRLNPAERAYIEIRAQKSKFRSDKKVREEMQRRGFLKGSDPQGQLITIASKARRKSGLPY